MSISPGDYAYVDSAGAVIIPAGSMSRVLDEAERIERDDAAFIEQIRDEDPTAVRRGTQITGER